MGSTWNVQTFGSRLVKVGKPRVILCGVSWGGSEKVIRGLEGVCSAQSGCSALTLQLLEVLNRAAVL